MNIKETFQKIKSEFKPLENDIILVLVIVFVGLIAFGLGRLSALSERKTPITVENLTAGVIQSNRSDTSVDKLFVASKNGAKYHFPWCSGAQRINEENKVWFSTKEEAEAAGYSPAANCKGL